MRISGRVIKEPFATGTKSERQAVLLETDQGRYVLRRQGGNPFHDPELEELVGKTIEAEGTLADYTFLMSRWHEP